MQFGILFAQQFQALVDICIFRIKFTVCYVSAYLRNLFEEDAFEGNEGETQLMLIKINTVHSFIDKVIVDLPLKILRPFNSEAEVQGKCGMKQCELCCCSLFFRGLIEAFSTRWKRNTYDSCCSAYMMKMTT